MQIFDKQLYGSDADYFLSLSCSDKNKWIKKNTNQQNDSLIDEFIKTVRADGDECQGCKDAKAKKSDASAIKSTPKKAVKENKAPERDEEA